MIEARNEPTQVEREAADWFTRLLHTQIENEELAEFEAWRLNPDNLAAYNRVEDISRLALSLHSDPEILAIANATIKQRAPEPDLPWHRRIFAGPRRRWATGIAIGGLATASAIGWKITAPTYSTTVGRQIVAQLSDGTRVRLNTDTALKVRFEDGVRRVELTRGQAFFDVAHDAAHPFIVVAGATQVRAIGTRFDVRRVDGGAKVVLAEGKVAVSEQGVRDAAWTLSPGQAVTTGKAVSRSAPTHADIAVATSWTEGRVSFRATPLADAVAEINRYSRDKIVLGADVPAATRVNGDFATDKPAEFVTAMTTLYGLRTERRLGGDIELRGSAN